MYQPWFYLTTSYVICSVDTVPPTISTVSDVSLTCGSDYSPSALTIPMVSDNEDPNPSLTHQDLPSAQCSVQRVWTATDEAGNTATRTQTITFTVPQPPQITAPSRIDIPCGSVEDAIRNAAQTGLLVVHPCGRPITVTFNDSARVDRCGFTFTRTWRVQDDCGSVSTFMQTIQVLSLQLPGGPENGQVNTRLDEPLLWPQFPGAYSYKVYVWQYGTQRPSEPTAVVSTRTYRPSSNYAPGTRYLWQIEYVTGVNTTVPSPIWGFETQSFPDLTVSTITVPPYAFSGQDFQLSWTVINIGNLSSGVSVFYDAVNMGPTTDFSGSRRVATIQQNRFVDPQDGYTSSVTVNLQNNDIGNFYLFVETDLYGQVSPCGAELHSLPWTALCCLSGYKFKARESAPATQAMAISVCSISKCRSSHSLRAWSASSVLNFMVREEARDSWNSESERWN